MAGHVSEPGRGRRRARWRIALDCVLAAAGVGVAVWRLAPTLAAVPDLGARLAELRWTWLAVAVLSAAASLVVYGELQRRALCAGGARLPVASVQAVNFIGNAFAQTVPSAGSAAGAAYAVAAFRRRGVDTALSVWSSVLTALLSAATLLVAGPLVLASDGLLSLPAGAATSAALAALAGAAWFVLRRPASLRWIVSATLAVARHLPVLRNAEWAARRSAPAAAAIAQRIGRFRLRPGLWAQFTAVALVGWALDYGALVACVATTAQPVPWAALATGYLAVQASIALQLTPAGTGPAETGLLAALATGGVPAVWAAVVVVLYRAIAWLGLASVGWVVFLVVARRRNRRARTASVAG